MGKIVKIHVKTSKQLTNKEWENYLLAYNTVFKNPVKIEVFKKKYYNTIDNYSYHSLLINNKKIVGGYTVIPYLYYFDNTVLKIGLSVDGFILKEYRKNRMLHELYESLKQLLKKNNINMVIGVPVDYAYPYFKKIMKWQDIGFLRYYALPVKLGNIVGILPKTINFFSKTIINILLLISALIFSTEKRRLIRIDRTQKTIFQQRYSSEHETVKLNNFSFSYFIEKNKKGTVTCYIVDYINLKKDRKDSTSLRKTIKYIHKTETVDLIIFIGNIAFFQFLLFRVPYNMEPSHQCLVTDILDLELFNNKKYLYNIKNWDFGLFNIDVR